MAVAHEHAIERVGLCRRVAKLPLLLPSITIMVCIPCFEHIPFCRIHRQFVIDDGELHRSVVVALCLNGEGHECGLVVALVVDSLYADGHAVFAGRYLHTGRNPERIPALSEYIIDEYG